MMSTMLRYSPMTSYRGDSNSVKVARPQHRYIAVCAVDHLARAFWPWASLGMGYSFKCYKRREEKCV